MKAINLQTVNPRRLLLLFLLGLLASSGGCELEKESLWSPTVGWPVVTGTVYRDENGDILGVFGNPEDRSLVVYPSPAIRTCSIYFVVSERTRVTAWVSRALGPGDADPGYDAGFGSTRIPILPPAEVTTLLDSYLDPDGHRCQWNGEDDRGVEQPTGWYRIYARIGTEVLFSDIWWINGDDIRFPPGFWDSLYPEK